jgi:hypothetical protein
MVSEVFVECAEKTGFPGFGSFRLGENCALRGRAWLREQGTQVVGSKDGGWGGYTQVGLGSPKRKFRIIV